MGTQFNIKSEEAYAIASELSGMTGNSMTRVVLDALRAQRQRLSREARIAEIRQFCRDTAESLSPRVREFDIDTELYDAKTGLPK